MKSICYPKKNERLSEVTFSYMFLCYNLSDNNGVFCYRKILFDKILRYSLNNNDAVGYLM